MALVRNSTLDTVLDALGIAILFIAATIPIAIGVAVGIWIARFLGWF